MPSAVSIRTGARLHFGPFAVAGEAGIFGGIGLMVDEPGCELTVARKTCDELSCPPELSGRLTEVLQRMRDARCIDRESRQRIQVTATIPAHAGLGSGTQFALAVATALARLHRRPEADQTERLAAIVGRGRRSAIGIHGFARGGFLVDGGKADDDAVGGLAARLEFPGEWPVLLWTPRDATGLSGEAERRAFRELPPMSEATTLRLRGTIEERLLPALRSGRFTNFAAALNDYGDDVGSYFSAVQGDVYAHPRAAPLVAWLRSNFDAGVAQTSWGPTLVAILPDAAAAHDVAAHLPSRPGEVRLTRSRNRGADVRISD
jgi:beta-ribofuranosylaminobenzene 5'-phosphate synthase